MGNDNSILIIGAVVLGYFLFIRKDVEGLTAAENIADIYTDPDKACSLNDWLFSPLVCAAKTGYQAVKPSSTTGTEHSPQTPAPQPTKCPYDSNLLYGDARCYALYPKYPTIEGSISSSELCNPSSPYYVGDAVANAPGGCFR